MPTHLRVQTRIKKTVWTLAGTSDCTVSVYLEKRVLLAGVTLSLCVCDPVGPPNRVASMFFISLALQREYVPKWASKVDIRLIQPCDEALRSKARVLF